MDEEESPITNTPLSLSLTAAESSSFPDVEEVRIKFRELAASDKIDKADALTMMSLFHTMENLLQHECGIRDRVILETNARLERNRLETECDRLVRKQTLDMQQQQQQQQQQTIISSRRR
jgi:hypothetical protein